MQSGLRCVLDIFSFSFFVPGVGRWAVAIACGCLLVPGAWAQEPQEEFDSAMARWKEALIEYVEIRQELGVCEESEFEELRAKLAEARQRGNELRLEAIRQGARLYKALPNNREELQRFLAPLPAFLYEIHQYGLAAEVNDALLAHDPANHAVLFDGIKAAFFANRFDLAGTLMEKWRQLLGDPPPELSPIAAALPAYSNRWDALQKELADRPEGFVNPRISLKLGPGTIVIELDEDRYPVIVNNIVAMIEKQGMYQGTSLFEVVEHQAVRGGCPRNDGTTALPIAKINPEIIKKASLNFRGTFSLMMDPATSTVTSQFAIARIPRPDLEGRFLPVGRVVSGMEIVDGLAATHTVNDKMEIEKVENATPDRIVETRVTQRREHEYVRNNKVEEPVAQ